MGQCCTTDAQVSRLHAQYASLERTIVDYSQFKKLIRIFDRDATHTRSDIGQKHPRFHFSSLKKWISKTDKALCDSVFLKYAYLLGEPQDPQAGLDALQFVRMVERLCTPSGQELWRVLFTAMSVEVADIHHPVVDTRALAAQCAAFGNALETKNVNRDFVNACRELAASRATRPSSATTMSSSSASGGAWDRPRARSPTQFSWDEFCSILVANPKVVQTLERVQEVVRKATLGEDVWSSESEKHLRRRERLSREARELTPGGPFVTPGSGEETAGGPTELSRKKKRGLDIDTLGDGPAMMRSVPTLMPSDSSRSDSLKRTTSLVRSTSLDLSRTKRSLGSVSSRSEDTISATALSSSILRRSHAGSRGSGSHGSHGGSTIGSHGGGSSRSLNIGNGGSSRSLNIGHGGSSRSLNIGSGGSSRSLRISSSPRGSRRVAPSRGSSDANHSSMMLAGALMAWDAESRSSRGSRSARTSGISTLITPMSLAMIGNSASSRSVQSMAAPHPLSPRGEGHPPGTVLSGSSGTAPGAPTPGAGVGIAMGSLDDPTKAFQRSVSHRMRRAIQERVLRKSTSKSKSLNNLFVGSTRPVANATSLRRMDDSDAYEAQPGRKG